MRDVHSLAGDWQFQIDPDGSLTLDTLQPDRTIPVPLPWQAAFPALQQYSGYAWYRTTFAVSAAAPAGELLLHFGAVDYWCQIFVNGQLAGEHEGGYMPITLPIRRYVQAGPNTLVVRVYDSVQRGIETPRWPAYPAMSSPPGPPFDANHIPHGKQEWYINVGGIWQDVTLTVVPLTYVDHVGVTPDIHSGEAHIIVELAGEQSAIGTLHIRVTDDYDAAELTLLLTGAGRYEAALRLESPHRWSPDDPHLYTATVRVQTAAGEDSAAVRFGYRAIRTAAGHLLLNDAPLFLLCALDQDLYPETIYTVPSVAFLRDEFAKAKALGLNCLRCHIKPPDPRYLDLADEMGLLIWTEIPSWRTFYPKGTVHANLLNLDDTIKARAEQLLAAMIRRDGNHPAIIIWTLVNEDWGTALPLSAADRVWMRMLYERCKVLDPTRLVVDNSACPHPWGPNIHVVSDLDDFHLYANIPDQAQSFTHAIEQFALRPLWTYSSHGDSRRSGQEPLILSEFGNWGLPTLGPLRAAGGHDPAWFNLGPWWSPWEGEPGWPQGVEDRFHALGLDRLWPDYDSFARATQWHQFHAMQFEIATIRRQPTLAGYVITEFTDAYWESNGLLDFTRGPKVYHARFHEINAPDVILAAPQCYAAWDDQPLRITLHTAHYSAASWAGAQLQWQVGDNTTAGEILPVAALPPGGVQRLGSISVALPRLAAAQTVPIRLVLAGANGQSLAQSQIDVLVLPAAARTPRYTALLTVIATEGAADDGLDPPALAAGAVTEPGGAVPPAALTADPAAADSRVSSLVRRLQRLGYRTTHRLSADGGLAVSNYPTAELLAWVRAGGDLLFLSQGASPFYWVQGRGGTYGGSWMTSFSWLRPAPYARLAVVNPLSLPYDGVMPQRTILGLPVTDPAVQNDFLAGQVSGWVNHPAIHTVQFRYGAGRVIMTTFLLEKAPAADPVGIAMLHDLIEYLHSDRCRPVLTANY